MLNLTASLPEQSKDLSPQITVVGVGGAGCNAVNNMIASKLEGVRFVTCNTDAQALKHSLASTRLQLGTRITSGLGAGSKPEIGRAAAEESIDAIMAEIDGANMVFITAGMGGGTGTGAAPVIARAAKEAGILTVGVVTKPFHFEGAHRMRMAETGLSEMQQYVDTLIVIPNQNLFRIANEKTTFAEAFRLADSVLQSGVRGVTDLMVMPGLINLDFADVRTAMMEMGKAMMGTGESGGDRRAIEAAERAINNPLLDDISMKGARGVIINITGGFDMTLFEVDEACNRIRDEVDGDANIIFGSTFDESLEGVMRVTVLATGIEAEAGRRARPIRPSNTVAQGQQFQPQQPQQQQSQNYNAPQSQGGAMDGMYGSASGVQQQLVIPSASSRVSAPSAAQHAVYAQEGMTVRRVNVQEAYQPELGIAAAPPQASPPPASAAPDLSRGVRYGGAFIPPRPVDPEGARAFAATQNADDDLAFMPQASLQPKGLNLNPPVPGSKKRAPSLFDKITSMFTEGDDAEGEASSASSSSGTSSGGGLFSGFSAPRRMSPSVNVQPVMQAEPEVYVQRQPVVQPVAAPQPQNAAPDLEIPAFLRRQIS